MKQWLLIAGISGLLAACGSEDKKDSVTTEAPGQQRAADANQVAAPVNMAPMSREELLSEAKAAVQALGGTLKGELQKAMKSGGPLNALVVCNTQAPEIAGTVSAEKNLQISRVSLKNRNPDTGKPNAWQIKVLEDFETRKTDGESPANLTYSETVEQGGQQEFRFMKAIPTDKLCLVCHGTQISPAIQTKLNELYPDDKAVGYRAGDLRGAFAVVKSLN